MVEVGFTLGVCQIPSLSFYSKSLNYEHKPYVWNIKKIIDWFLILSFLPSLDKYSLDKYLTSSPYDVNHYPRHNRELQLNFLEVTADV